MYKIACVHFDKEWFWEVMRKGFVKSVKQNTTAELDFRLIPPPKQTKLNWKLSSNNEKLKIWRDIVHESDKPVVLMDSDIIVLDDINDGFQGDITLTSRPGRWVNAGVVFCRPTQTARDFMDAWVKEDQRLSSGNVAGGRPTNLLRAQRKTKVLGMNQTALRVIYDDWKDHIAWVKGEIYNSCQPSLWEKRDNARVIHVKDELQHDLLRLYKGGKTQIYHTLAKELLAYYIKPKP